MSYIVIRFAHYMSTYEGAPVPVQVFDKNSNQVFAEPIRLTSSGTRIEQDFVQGTYLVRAALPSGEVLADTVELRDEQGATAVFKSKHPSPREELSWAYYLQRGPRPFLPASKSLRENVIVGVVQSLEPPIILFWSHNPDRWEVVSREDPTIFRNVYFDPAPDLQVERATIRIVINFSDSGNWRSFPSQIWLQAGNAVGSKFVALPLVQRLQVLITGIGRSFQQFPLQIQTSNGDATVESLLSFLESGDFASARSVGSNWAASAEKLLQEKINDPIAATVAGYFLVRAGELSRLHDWTRNLANWFEWLPDGPVIRAWHLMSKPDPDVEEIRSLLLKAANRGLPYYSMGLRMLQSGLKLFVQRNASDEEIIKALNTINPYLAARDPYTQVTSFFGKDPYHPGSMPPSTSRYGVGRDPTTGHTFRFRRRRSEERPGEHPWESALARQSALARESALVWKRRDLRREVGNKTDLAYRISSACNIGTLKARCVVDTLFGSITAALRKGDRVALMGFGIFSVSQRKARSGRNPQTGATIKIVARNVAKFSAGAELKKAVNSK